MLTKKTTKIHLPSVVGASYKDWWNTKKRYAVCKGSRGSKKSKTTYLWLVYNIMKHRQANAVCVRRYQNTLRDSCFSDVKWAATRFSVLHKWDFKVSPMEATYKPTGQKILFRGLDDGVKITSISVPEGVLCWAILEEAYEILEDDFNKLDMSIRGEMPAGLWKQLRLIFNPWSEQSWLKRRFFDEPDDDLKFTKTTTYKCNEWLDEADIRIFEQMKKNNPRRYRIEGEGEWGIAEGLIYENAKQESFDVDIIRAKQGIKSAFSLDFGWSDTNAFICSMVDDAAMRIYIFDEWYKNGCTNQQIAEQIKAMGYGGQKIICDAAEPKSIQELCDNGLRAWPSRKGKDSVDYGIQLIQNYKIIVHPRCKEFWKEVTNYCWAKDAKGNRTGKPDHEFSHGPDALRYGVTDVAIGNSFSWD